MKVAQKETKAQSKYIGVFPLEFDEGATNDETGEVAIPNTIHLVPIGQWEHDLYGQIIITAADIREFIQNFNMKVRKGVYITAGHEGFEELPAVGWLSAVEARDNGLWGTVEWNDLGSDILGDKQFKFFSPEFVRDYEDPETHQAYRNVLTGGALTKSPYFKELEAIIFSEPKFKKFNDNQMTLVLQDVLAKKVEELTDEEKAFVKEHAAELSDEQKTALATVLAPAETEEEKKARGDKEASDKAAQEEKEKGDANEAAGLNRDGSAKETVQASEKNMVKINASELKALQDKANQGAQAFAELEAKKLSEIVNTLSFSETNKNGKFLPKSKDKLQSFMGTLNEAQRAKFSELVSELPATKIFTEVGAGAGAGEGTAKAEVETLVTKKMSENKDLNYSDALKQVFSDNQGLSERYNEEVAA